MDPDDLLAESFRRVRSRYTNEDFGDLALDRVVREVKEEAEKIKASRPAIKTTSSIEPRGGL
jgi:hypothetical protein